MKPFLISIITKFKACSLGVQAAIWCGSVAVVAGAICVPVIIVSNNKPVVEEVASEPENPVEDIAAKDEPASEPEPEPTPEEPKEEVKPEPTPVATPQTQTKPTTNQNTNCPNGCTPVVGTTPLPKKGDPNYYQERCYMPDEDFFTCYLEDDNLTKEQLEAWWMVNFGSSYVPPEKRLVFQPTDEVIYGY